MCVCMRVVHYHQSSCSRWCSVPPSCSTFLNIHLLILFRVVEIDLLSTPGWLYSWTWYTWPTKHELVGKQPNHRVLVVLRTYVSIHPASMSGAMILVPRLFRIRMNMASWHVDVRWHPTPNHPGYKGCPPWWAHGSLFQRTDGQMIHGIDHSR